MVQRCRYCLLYFVSFLAWFKSCIPGFHGPHLRRGQGPVRDRLRRGHWPGTDEPVRGAGRRNAALHCHPGRQQHLQGQHLTRPLILIEIDH